MIAGSQKSRTETTEITEAKFGFPSLLLRPG